MIYVFTDFDKGPHWEVAFIEADSEEQAVEIFRDKLSTEETISNLQPEQFWRISHLIEPLTFILGSGCR